MKFKILPITADASFRKFYRLILNKKKKILVIAKKEKYRNLIIYSSVNRFLRKNGIFTPKLFWSSYKRGIIVIEDFGNLSFHKILLKQKKKLNTYKKLVDLILKIQKIKAKKKIKNILGKSYTIDKYSHSYLHKETDLFFDWYLALFFSKKKVSKIKKKTKKILTTIYNKLNFPNSSFVHRDFHSQNLIKVGNKVGVIDTQDALIGNPAYDLVSLIDDVRIKNSIKLKNQIYDYYIKKKFKNYENNSKKFMQDFNILSVQRSLKIIGIFSRLFKRDKKGQYLRFIPYTWQLIEMRMKDDIFSELKKVLDSNITKKIRRKTISK